MEVRQEIQPVCCFGRAENVFYQSHGALRARDLDLDGVLSLISDGKNPVFPSHVLDREDWPMLLEESAALIHTRNLRPRVQIAMGREWEDLSDKVHRAAERGWGVDILVDRPLTQLTIPPDLRDLSDFRWIAVPLRFYDPCEVLRTLRALEDGREIWLGLMEPASGKNMLPNMDEILLWRDRLSKAEDLRGIGTMILLPPRSETRPSVEFTHREFVDRGDLKRSRAALAAAFENLPQLSSMLIFVLRGRIFQPWFLRRTADWIRSTVRAFFQTCYWSVYGTYWRLHGFIRALSVRGYWRVYAANGALRAMAIHAFWFLRSFLIGAFHRIYWGTQGAVRKIARFIFWPLYKAYWFFEYQYGKRLKPLVQRTRSK